MGFILYRFVGISVLEDECVPETQWCCISCMKSSSHCDPNPWLSRQARACRTCLRRCAFRHAYKMLSQMVSALRQASQSMEITSRSVGEVDRCSRMTSAPCGTFECISKRFANTSLMLHSPPSLLAHPRCRHQVVLSRGSAAPHLRAIQTNSPRSGRQRSVLSCDGLLVNVL